MYDSILQVVAVIIFIYNTCLNGAGIRWTAVIVTSIRQLGCN